MANSVSVGRGCCVWVGHDVVERVCEEIVVMGSVVRYRWCGGWVGGWVDGRVFSHGMHRSTGCVVMTK